MSQRKVSLTSQIAVIRYWIDHHSKRGIGRSAAEVDLRKDHTFAVLGTLDWLQEHEREIRAFLALPAETRGAVLEHGPTVAQLAVEIAKRQAIARAGGPVR